MYNLQIYTLIGQWWTIVSGISVCNVHIEPDPFLIR